jgi:hypothetical protein
LIVADIASSSTVFACLELRPLDINFRDATVMQKRIHCQLKDPE